MNQLAMEIWKNRWRKGLGEFGNKRRNVRRECVQTELVWEKRDKEYLGGTGLSSEVAGRDLEEERCERRTRCKEDWRLR